MRVRRDGTQQPDSSSNNSSSRTADGVTASTERLPQGLTQPGATSAAPAPVAAAAAARSTSQSGRSTAAADGDTSAKANGAGEQLHVEAIQADMQVVQQLLGLQSMLEGRAIK